MKKRFLVAAMACAVALGSFGGYVFANDLNNTNPDTNEQPGNSLIPNTGNNSVVSDIANMVTNGNKEVKHEKSVEELNKEKMAAYLKRAVAEFDKWAQNNLVKDHKMAEVSDYEFDLAAVVVLGAAAVDKSDYDDLKPLTTDELNKKFVTADLAKVADWAMERKAMLYKAGYADTLHGPKALDNKKADKKADKKVLPNTSVVR